MSEQARGELDGGLRVDLRECRFHDFIHADAREVLRVFAGQDQVVDHLVRDRADRVAVVHDGHLRELPVTHFVDRGRERDLRLDVLDLLRLDLIDERLLLLSLQLGLEGRHHAPDDVVGGIHLFLLDLHDRRLADVRESRERGLREPEGLPQARDLLQVGHHCTGQGAYGTYSCRNFQDHCILLADGPDSGGRLHSGTVLPTSCRSATKAIYAPPHPRRTADGGLPWREISTSRNSSIRRSNSKARRSSSARGSATRTASPTVWRKSSRGRFPRCISSGSGGSSITTRIRSRSSGDRARRSSAAASSSNRRTSSWSAGRRRW